MASFAERSDCWLLGGICLKLEIVAPALNVLVTDGESGHTIVLSGLNGVDFQHPRGQPVRRGWFSFYDPWPARSLLARSGITTE